MHIQARLPNVLLLTVSSGRVAPFPWAMLPSNRTANLVALSPTITCNVKTQAYLLTYTITIRVKTLDYWYLCKAIFSCNIYQELMPTQQEQSKLKSIFNKILYDMAIKDVKPEGQQ